MRATHPGKVEESHLDLARPNALDKTIEQVARILGRPQPVAPWVLPCGTRLTSAWPHEGLDCYVAGMNGHLIVTYHRHEQRADWSMEDRRLAATLRPGTLTVIPETHDGNWSVGGRLEASHVYLSDKRLQSCAEQLQKAKPVELVRRLGHEDSAVARVLELLSQEVSNQSVPTLFLDEALDLLCFQLIRRHSAFPDIRTKAPRRGLTPRQLRLVTQYMRENLHREITLEELAGLLHLSRFHLCTVFRLATGKRPHEWLTLQRIEPARRLLQDRSLRIIDVCLAVGYQTPSAFAAAFRKTVGDTPSNYRRHS